MRVLNKTSTLRDELGAESVRFLEHALGGIGRLLPHAAISRWREESLSKDAKPGASWSDRRHQEITLRVVIAGSRRQLTGTVTRRDVPRATVGVPNTLDARELGICNLIVCRIAQVLRAGADDSGAATTLRSVADSFDEEILSEHLRRHHGIAISMSSFLRAIHQLAETTYENSALAFGCIIERSRGRPAVRDGSAAFLDALVRSKKYRALSDGYRTAYEVDAAGRLLRFRSLDRQRASGAHFSPEWTEWLAATTGADRVAICLTRSGDILLFAGGTMTFAYRFGQWKFWNHLHLVNLLKALAQTQKVPIGVTSRVVSAVYRAALDVSFRRTGALFLILRNEGQLSSVAREEDCIGHPRRDDLDAALDRAAVANRSLQSLPRAVVAELAALDGAMVLSSRGKLLAYGAVLRPRTQGELKGSEGSRTKAAIGASHYGVAVKVSADGEICVFYEGREFLKM